jgi:hypothetical protein
MHCKISKLKKKRVASCHQTKKIIKKFSALAYKFFCAYSACAETKFSSKRMSTNAQTKIFKIEKKFLTFSLVGGLYVLVDCIVIVILKVHKIEIYFGFDFEICIISLLVMSKY